MISSIIGAGTGSVFWVIAARFYSAEKISLASAIISTMSNFQINGLIILILVGFTIINPSLSVIISKELSMSFIISLGTVKRGLRTIIIPLPNFKKR